MKGQQSAETPVGAPASVVWGAYRGLELGTIVNEVLGDVLGKAECVEGDGNTGTIMKLTFPPGTPGLGYLIEKFTKMDDNERVKETEQIEGDFKNMGFNFVRVRLEIVEKDTESSIIRSTIEYEVDESKSELASMISIKPFEIMAEGVGKYLVDKKPTA